MKNKIKMTLLLLALSILIPNKNVISNDFPTLARSEFVFACMSSNANNRDFMAKCSCAVDEIAKRINYEEYGKVLVQEKKHLRALVFQKKEWINSSKLKQRLN